MKQAELFVVNELGDGRYNTFEKRRKAIMRIIQGLERGDRRRKESRAEHDHAEDGGTDYMKNAFRGV